MTHLPFSTGVGAYSLLRQDPPNTTLSGRSIPAAESRTLRVVRALDLFCCGGGASEGLRRAGFDVTGVDVEPQPHYPFRFIRADATILRPEWLATFDLVWASPPCQRFSRITPQPRRHPDLIDAVRRLLRLAGGASVIENIPEAPLRADLRLCGKMFGLPLRRHRHFELTGFSAAQPEHPDHVGEWFTVSGHTGSGTGQPRRNGGQHHKGLIADWRRAMGIDWLPESRLREAIPPVYAEHIGRAFMTSVAG